MVTSTKSEPGVERRSPVGFFQSFFKKNKKMIGIWVFFAIATIVMTWPTFPNMATQVADMKDPLLVASIFGFGKEHLLKGEFLQYFETNNSYPYTNTLTYTDHSLVLTIMSLPVALFTDNLILVYNFVLLVSWFLIGLSGFYLAHYYTKSYSAGLVAGIILAFNPPHFAQFTHIQTNTYQFIPFTVLFLEKSIIDGGRKNYLLFLFFCLAAVGVSFYHVTFLAVIIAIILAFRFLVTGELKNWKKVLALGVCFIPVGMLALLLSLPYLKLSEEQNVIRPIEQVIYNSATFDHYLTAGPSNLLYGSSAIKRTAEEPFFSAPEHSLFLGVAVYLLVLISFVKLKDQFKLHKTRLLYLIIAAVAFILSLGPYLVLNQDSFLAFAGNPIPLPYKFLYDHVVLFQGVRVPTRFITVIVLAFAILAGIAVQRLNQASPKYGKFASLGLVAIMLVEFISVPVPSEKIRFPYDETYEFIARQPGTDWSIFEYPTFIAGDAYDAETYTVYYSVKFNKKTLNGYSVVETSQRLNHYIDANFNHETDTVIDILAGVKVKFLVIRADRISDVSFRGAMLARLNENPYSKLVFHQDMNYVYQLSDRTAALKVDPGISYTYTGTTLDKDGVAFANITVRNNSSRIWTNPDLDKYELSAEISGAKTGRKLLKPLYLLPGEEVRQMVKLNQPLFWDKNVASITVAVKSSP